VFKALGGFITLLIAVGTFVFTFHPFGPGSPTVRPRTALQVIDNARNAPLTDASGTITIGGILPGSGTFLLTKNPSASTYTTTSSFSTGGTPTTITTVTIGKVTYERKTPPSTAPWTKTTNPSPRAVPVLSELFMPYTNPTLVGRESVNGRDSYHLKQTVPNSLGSETYDIWIRADTFFPSKQVHTFPLIGGLVTSHTLLFTSWNAGETISPPI
jgi:hypothetical protein